MTRNTSISLVLTAAMMWAAPAHAERLPLNTIGGPAGVDAVRTPISACGTIAAPGSYVVVKNLAATGTCLFITADHVTIDLNGFTLSGDGTGSGITTDGTNDNRRLGIAVYHGTVTGFDDGLPLFFASGVTVAGVRAHTNAGDGINVGFASTVSGNTANGNGGSGITALSGSTVSGNTANKNFIFGIIFSGNSTVTGNTANGNTTGILGNQFGSTVTGNTARDNGNGIVLLCPSNVIDNTATSNTVENLDLIVLAGGGPCNNINNVTAP